jgi:hypothetical protein
VFSGVPKAVVEELVAIKEIGAWAMMWFQLD